MRVRRGRWVKIAVALATVCLRPNFAPGAPASSAASTWTAPAQANRLSNPVPLDDASVGRGGQLYQRECAVCHGATGRGDGPKSGELRANPGDLSNPAMLRQSDGALFWKITRGRTPMPAYRAQFSERDRWSLVNYMRTLAPRQPGAIAEAKPAATGTNAPAGAAKRPAPGPPPRAGRDGYVSRQEYQQLKAEHEQLRQELEALKTRLGISIPRSVPPAGTNAPAVAGTNATATAAAESAPEPTEMEGLEDQIKQVLPGSTKFLLTGSGAAGFSGERHGDSAFSAEFRPIFLWQLSDRLFFESIVRVALDNNESDFDLEVAQISYLVNDYLTLGAGKFLAPMNYFQERARPALINKFPDKPLAVNNGPLPETTVGFQLRGAVPLASTKLEWAFYAGNGPRLVTDDPLRAGVLEFDNFNNRDGHIAVGGRVGFFPFPELGVGYGFQLSGVGPRDQRADSVLHSVDLNYFRGSDRLKGTVSLIAQWVWSEVDALTYDSTGSLGFGPLTFNNRRNGGYVQFAYRPSKVDHDVIRRLEPVIRYDRFNQHRTPMGFNQQRWTIGLNYWLGPNAVLKAAYQFNESDRDDVDDLFLFQFAVGL